MITNINPFFLISMATGLCVCSVLSLLGCVVIWKKQGYIGEAISHASILGVILSFAFSINISIAAIIFSIIFALILYFTNNTKMESLVSLIASYTLLSIGIISLTFFDYINVDFMSFLFGDILLVNYEDFILSLVILLISCGWLSIRWKDITYSCVHEELAKIEGIKVKRINLEFLIFVSVIIGLSIKIIGILLVSAILIIPSSAASNISYSPVGMMIKSVIISLFSLVGGLVISIAWDTPTGASIVICAASIFIISLFLNKKRIV